LGSSSSASKTYNTTDRAAKTIAPEYGPPAEVTIYTQAAKGQGSSDKSSATATTDAETTDACPARRAAADDPRPAAGYHAAAPAAGYSTTARNYFPSPAAAAWHDPATSADRTAEYGTDAATTAAGWSMGRPITNTVSSS